MHLTTCLLIFTALLVPSVITAQDEAPPAPEFLYRSGNRLYLVNGYTGEETELPFEVGERDQFEWSPDGQYLLAKFTQNDTTRKCINLYDVDQTLWLYEEFISCGVGDVVFDRSGERITYVATEEGNATLWLHNLTDKTDQELYHTTEGESPFDAGISNIMWSPTESYLTFVDYNWILGGTLNVFVVMDTDGYDHVTVTAPSAYYANYEPIWSHDDEMFLIVLLEDYLVSATIPQTNHRGDVYLVNSNTGEKHRLSYTPASREFDIGWTEGGAVTFSEHIVNNHTFTLEQAMNVEEVPRDEIIMPEPVDVDLYVYNRSISNSVISPDPRIGAWTSSIELGNGENMYEIVIRSYRDTSEHRTFSVIAQNRHDFLGWRPSDYPYEQN